MPSFHPSFSWARRAGVIVVLPHDFAARFAAGGEIRARMVDAQEHAHALARIRLSEAEEFVAVGETLAAERANQRMARVVELDGDRLIGVLVGRAATAEHEAELGPVLHAAGPAPERDRCAVNAQQAAAAGDELDQVLPEFGVGEQIADGVVEEHGIERLK